MDKIKELIVLALSSDKNILITALVIVFTIVIIANVFGKLATAMIGFVLIFLSIVIAPFAIKNSYKKFDKDKKDNE